MLVQAAGPITGQAAGRKIFQTFILTITNPATMMGMLAIFGTMGAALQLTTAPARAGMTVLGVMLGSLARLWVAGASVNWTRFSRHERRRRVSLPPYPFQKEHYWIGLPEQSSGTVAQESEPAQQRNVGDWFYVPSWKPALQEPRRGATGEPKPSRWLVFGSGTEFDSRLRERLAEWARVVGEERLWVSPSCGFGRHPPRDIPVLKAKMENMVEAARTL